LSRLIALSPFLIKHPPKFRLLSVVLVAILIDGSHFNKEQCKSDEYIDQSLPDPEAVGSNCHNDR
jgi:hypothetical protein